MDGTEVLIKQPMVEQLGQIYLFDLSGSYRSLYFLDQNIGWAAADGGKIKKTTNGGTNGLIRQLEPMQTYNLSFL